MEPISISRLNTCMLCDPGRPVAVRTVCSCEHMWRRTVSMLCVSCMAGVGGECSFLYEQKSFCTQKFQEENTFFKEFCTPCRAWCKSFVIEVWEGSISSKVCGMEMSSLLNNFLLQASSSSIRDFKLGSYTAQQYSRAGWIKCLYRFRRTSVLHSVKYTKNITQHFFFAFETPDWTWVDHTRSKDKVTSR